jgi:hypothetical protein
MALHLLNIRCEECWHIYSVRRPNDSLLITAIVAAIRCPRCHPEALVNVCAACRLPFALFPHHADGMCFTCFQRQRRFLALQRVGRA